MTGDVYSLSPPGLNARQKKHLKRKQNLKEKKAREKEDAGLWPEDVHKPEREALLSSFQAALAEVPRLGTLPAVEAIALANDTDRRIGTLEKVMMESIAVEEAKNERPPRGETKEALGDRIKALISKRERDEVSLNSLLRVYGVCLCWEGLKQYKSSIAALTAACTELRQGNQSAIDAANRFRAREELLGRVNDLLQAKEMDPIDLEDLISVNVDVTVEGVNLLFVPPNSLQRRISQLYSVIVERPRGRQARGTSLVQVHGEESAVAGVMAFLKKCDWTCGGKASQEVHRRLIGAIVGRGGSGIRAIEEETRCILRMDETHLKIYGEPSNVDAVLKKIDTIRSDNEQAAFVTADVLVPSSIARYIQRYSLSELRDLYSKCQGASIRVVLQGSDNQGHLVVRARVDDCATLEADVKKLIAGLSFVELPATGRAVGRVFGAMSPRRVLAKEIRLTERTPAEEFSRIIETSSLMVNRVGFRVEDSETCALQVCGATSVVEGLRPKLQELLMKAGYVDSQLIISRLEYRCIGDDSLSLISAETAARVFYQIGNRDSVTIGIRGSDEQKAAAEIMLKETVAKMAQIEEVTVESEAVMRSIRRNRFEVLQQWQDLYGVLINARDEVLEISGSGFAVADAKEGILQFIEETAEHENSLVTESITIPRASVGLVVGRGGATIQNIRTTSGVDSIDINDTDDQSTNVSVTVIGNSTGLILAKKMIEQATGPRAPAPNRSAGRGRGAPRVSKPAPRKDPEDTPNLEADFPSLDSHLENLPSTSFWRSA